LDANLPHHLAEQEVRLRRANSTPTYDSVRALVLELTDDAEAADRQAALFLLKQYRAKQ